MNKTIIGFEVEGSRYIWCRGSHCIASCVQPTQVELDIKQCKLFVCDKLFTTKGNFWDHDRNGKIFQS